MADSGDLAAVDATGLESHHASAYYGYRTGRKYHRFPKISEVVDVESHLCLAAVVDRGPSPDNLELHAVARQARRRHAFKALAGDLAYDGEHHHRYLYERLGVIGLIPPRRGRPPKDPARHQPPGFFRRFWHQYWRHAESFYGQRWQAETRFSMEKRLLGSCLRARRRAAQDREAYLRTITLNLMISAAGP